MSTDLESLRAQTRGMVIGPADPDYDTARAVRNGMIDKRPAVVVRPANAGDVMTAVRFAADSSLTVAVRGGAHSVPGFGTAEGAVVIDLSGMRGVRVDPDTRTARVEGGATWGDLNAATYPFGLATTGGIISTTGVGGLTLGGGIGYLSRGLGLSLDNLVAADVVTADGAFHLASEKDDADLFWAIRGGGGNFGVVTSFEFRLSPVKDIYGGPMFFELDRAADLIGLYREFIADAPEQFGGFPAYQIAPPLPFIPEERHGTTLALLVSCWAGDLDKGEKVLKPFRDLAPSVAEMVGPMPYPALNNAFDDALPAGAAPLLEGELRNRDHRRGDRGARRARVAGPGHDLDHAHLPDQRRLPPGGARRHGVRLSRRQLRDRDRRDVAGRGGRRAEHRVGPWLLRRDRTALTGGWLHQLHG